MAEELKYLGFHTVEQIAEANDGAVAKHAGLTNLKVKARAYLELAAGNTKPIEEMTRTVQELQQQLNGRDELIENMKARLDALEKGDKTAKGVTTK
jgi:hypothetical protein